MEKKHIRIIKNITWITVFSIMVAYFSACGKSTISMQEAGERLSDIGSDFVTGERTTTENEMKREAYTNAVDYIKNMLVNPSSAKFSKCDEDAIITDYDNESFYTMIIEVEAENDLGIVDSTSFYVKVSGYPDYRIREITEIK